MLTTIEGIYREDGLVQLAEAAPAASPGRRVLVTFLEPAPGSVKEPTPGPRSRFSWDEALARTAPSDRGVSLADEVIAERHERD